MLGMDSSSLNTDVRDTDAFDNMISRKMTTVINKMDVTATFPPSNHCHACNCDIIGVCHALAGGNSGFRRWVITESHEPMAVGLVR